MSSYLIPIKWAILIFPFLSILFTLPYVIYQYHKYGSILVFRTIVVYMFILYLTTIYFLVILPLPSMDYVSSLNTPRYQLVPFNFIVDFIKDTPFIWNRPSTYLSTIMQPEFYQVIFNILMFVPFGLYLRYYFKCSFKKTLLFTFVVSLFFELTQLTGIYGIYPRSYRLFDVDDLMINTLGGLVGYFITPLFKFLPSRDRMDELAIKKSVNISFLRRFVGFLFDIIIFIFVYSILNIFFSSSNAYIMAFVLYNVIYQMVFKQTIGKKIVHLKLVSEEGDIKWYQYLIRYFILYYLIFNGPNIVIKLMNSFLGIGLYFQIIIGIVILLIIYLYILTMLDVLIAIFNKNKLFVYEKISKTKNISTIKSDTE